MSSRHCHSPRRGCALVRRGSIDQAGRLTRSPRRDTKLPIDLEFMMLRFLFRLTISLSCAAALAVLLIITLLGYFFPDPTRAKWQPGQPAELAQVLMRTTPQEEPVGRPTQAPAGTQEISKQTTSPAADIRSLPPSDGIPGPSAERDMGVRSNAHASEQQRQLGSAPMPETSPERARAPPTPSTIGTRRTRNCHKSLEVLYRNKTNLLTPLVQASARKAAAIGRAPLRMTIPPLRHLRRTTPQD